MMSGGTAFSEEKDMKKLRQLSLKGWHVSGFKFMGYILEKGEKLDYIYNLDYRLLEEGEEEEYFNLFSSSGWSNVASEAGNIYFELILVQNQFIVIVIQPQKNIKTPVIP